MATKIEKIENSFAYRINPKKAKRKSHKKDKQSYNRYMRRQMKDLDFEYVRIYRGWEF